MAHPDAGLFAGIAALRAGLVPADRWARAALHWAARGDLDLADNLQAMGLLSSADAAALRKSSARPGTVGGTTRMQVTPAAGTRIGIPDDMEESGAAPTRQVPAPAAPPSEGPPAVFAFPAAPAGRFRLERELGRGGVGVVVEVTDVLLGRRAALKMVPAGASADALERFRWEARVAGRLEHPNIVTVHEIGVLSETRRPYLVMKKVDGRDMKAAIAGRMRLRKLVEAFRDVCRAVAHAHERGVIHRDLKPSNVMLGDYGEVVVVDWGLARVLGEREPVRAPGARPEGAPRGAHITLDGEILGTPSYMSPEQAQGRQAEVDARSDVWSLGAILYEILTARMPYEGATPADIIRRVVAGPPRPPSVLASVPATLEAICLRAMSHDRGARHATAAELAGDVDGWLEGAREKERREQSALAQVERARARAARLVAAGREREQAQAEAAALRAQIPGWAPEAERRKIWAVEDRVEALDRERAEAFADADTALGSALAQSPGQAEARALRAGLWWRRLEEAEGAADVEGAAAARRVVVAHDQGTYAAALRGDGTLSVTARVFPCGCLREGRLVRPEELAVCGVHPWTLGGFMTGGTQEVVRRRVHGAGCVTEPLQGAEVWAFRYELVDRVLVPVTPGPSRSPIPPGILDTLFGSSPYRPQGGGIYLGRTPVASSPWPGGSWLLLVAAAGRRPARVPILVRRGEACAPDVTLFWPDEIPPGMIPLAAGPAELQGDPGNPYSLPAFRAEFEDGFLASTPLTCAGYLEFVNDASTPADRAARIPRHDRQGALWPTGSDGMVAVPTAEFQAAHPEAVFTALPTTSAPWRSDWPALCVSPPQVMNWLAWRSAREERILMLPPADFRERASRGADARPFPWGFHGDPAFTNVQGSQPAGAQPVPVGSRPFDESPWGLRDLAGNSVDLCFSHSRMEFEGLGGGWAATLPYGRGSRRNTEVNLGGGIFFGFRPFSPVRVPARQVIP